jgi:redox-sensitive bicupin YhaK (pirin superfamily)
MEIISYVIEGALEHKDSMGTGSVIKPGDVQHMSAGTGVVHSEFNHSPTEKVHFLQIWIVPKERDIEPKYNQKYFSEEDKLNKLAKIISPDGSDNSIEINQDTTIYASIVDKDGEVKFTPSNDKDYWIHVVQGDVNFQEYNLNEGDGVAITKGELSEMTFRSSNKGEFLLFEV